MRHSTLLDLLEILTRSLPSEQELAPKSSVILI